MRAYTLVAGVGGGGDRPLAAAPLRMAGGATALGFTVDGRVHPGPFGWLRRARRFCCARGAPKPQRSGNRRHATGAKDGRPTNCQTARASSHGKYPEARTSASGTLFNRVHRVTFRSAFASHEVAFSPSLTCDGWGPGPRARERPARPLSPRATTNASTRLRFLSEGAPCGVPNGIRNVTDRLTGRTTLGSPLPDSPRRLSPSELHGRWAPRVWLAASPPEAGKAACGEACYCVGEAMAYTRITHDPEKMAGVPCIRGMRIPVATVVGLVAAGHSVPEILEYYPDLEAEDVTEALRFAADAVRERELPLTHVA